MVEKLLIIEGVTRKVHWNESVSSGRKRLNFRVEVIDENGDISKVVPVDADNIDFIDILTEGDKVEVNGTMQTNGMLSPRLIKNVQTGASIQLNNRKNTKYIIPLFAPFLLCLIGLFFNGLEGMVTAFILGLAFCLVTWIVMALIDKRQTN